MPQMVPHLRQQGLAFRYLDREAYFMGQWFQSHLRLGGSMGDVIGPQKGIVPTAVVIVDGSNACYSSGAKGTPSLRRLLAIRGELRKHNIDAVTIVDASLRHLIDDVEGFAGLLNAGELIQVPAGRRADDFIMQLALRRQSKGDNVYVLTNDLFPLKEGRGVVPRLTFLVVPWGEGEEPIFSPPLETIAETEPSLDEAQTPLTHPVIPPGSIEEPVPQTEISEDLLNAFLKFLISLDPPRQKGDTVPFTQVAGYLHNMFEGDFCKRFGYRKPKEFALALEAQGYVKLETRGLPLYLILNEKAIEGSEKLELEVGEPEVAAPSGGRSERTGRDLLNRALELLRQEQYLPTEERIVAKFNSVAPDKVSSLRTMLERRAKAGEITKAKEGPLTCYWPAAGRWEATNPNDPGDAYPPELWKDFEEALRRLPPDRRVLLTRYHLAKYLGEAGVPALQSLPQAKREHMVQLALKRKLLQVVPTFRGPRFHAPLTE